MFHSKRTGIFQKASENSKILTILKRRVHQDSGLERIILITIILWKL